MALDPSTSYKQFFNNSRQLITRMLDTVAKSADSKAQQEALKLLNSLGEELADSQDARLERAAIEDFSSHTNEVASRVQKLCSSLVFKEAENEEMVDNFESLQQTLANLPFLLLHKEDLAANNFAFITRDEDMASVFDTNLHEPNSWAKIFLQNALDSGNPDACKYVLKKFNLIKANSEDFSNEIILHPSIKAFIETHIQESEFQSDILNTLKYAISNSEDPWPLTFLADKFKKNDFYCYEAMSSILFDNFKTKPEIVDLFIEKLATHEEIAISSLSQLFRRNYADFPSIEPIYEKILHLAISSKNRYLEEFCVLQAIDIFCPPQIRDMLFENIQRFESPLFEGLDADTRKMIFNQVSGGFFNVSFPCTSMQCSLTFLSDFLKHNIKKLELQRAIHLFKFMTSGLTAPPTPSVCSKCFPKIKHILVGHWEEEGIIPNEFHRFLSPHDITVHSTIDPDDEDDISSEVRVSRPSHSPGRWVQDCVSFSVDETGKILTRMPRFTERREIPAETRNRLADTRLRARLANPSYEKPYNVLGGVALATTQVHMLDALLTKGENPDTISTNFSYDEGGNSIIGSDDDGPFVIIGRDTVDISKMFIENDLKKMHLTKAAGGQWSYQPASVDEPHLSEEDMKKIFARDYGIPEDRVHFVEQPGEFHLDMSLALMGGRTIILNDSDACASQMETEYKAKIAEYFHIEPSAVAYTTDQQSRLAEKVEAAHKIKELEDLTAEDLIAQGFEVKRVPGVFSDLYAPEPDLHQRNFFNFVSITTPKTDEKIIIALGYPPEYQEQFKAMIREHCQYPMPEANIHFMPLEISEYLLASNGGIQCYSKRIPLTPTSAAPPPEDLPKEGSA